MLVSPVKNAGVNKYITKKTQGRSSKSIKDNNDIHKLPLQSYQYGIKNIYEDYYTAEIMFRNNLANSKGIFGSPENTYKLIQNNKIRRNVVVFFHKYAQEQIDEIDKKKILTIDEVKHRQNLSEVRDFFKEYEESWDKSELEYSHIQNYPMVSFSGNMTKDKENHCKNIVHAYSAACGAISAAMGEGAAVGADTPFLRTAQFLMFLQLQQNLNVPAIPSLEYYAKEMCAGATLGVGGAKLVTSWFGIGAHTASALSGSSVVTAGGSDAVITGGVRAVNASLSTIITEKMGRGYVRRVKQNRMTFKDQTMEAGSYFIGRMVFANENPLSQLNNVDFKDPTSPELIKDVISKIPIEQQLATNTVLDIVSKDAGRIKNYFIANMALSLITSKEKDPQKIKQQAKATFKQLLIQTAVYELCDNAVKGQISKEAIETIKDMQENIEKYPEVFRVFQNAEYKFFEGINIDTLSSEAFTNQFKNKTFVYNLSNTCKQFIREFEESWINRNRQKQIENIRQANIRLLQEQQRNSQIENLSDEEKQELQAAFDEIEKTLKSQQEYFKSQKGFGYERIAGYESEKEEITQKFILPLSIPNKHIGGKVPGAILLYGVTGVGKTELAKSIAEQGKCKLISFRDVDTIEELNDYLKTLQNNAKKSERHTVIKIDEFDDYGSDSEAANLFRKFISEAPDNNITLLLTTNNPLDIDKELLNDLYTIPVNPPDKKNCLEVLKFYAGDLTEHELEELTDKLEQQSKNCAYSNAQIKKICTAANVKNNSNKKEFMLDLIEKTTPEIKEKDLAKFKTEKENIQGKTQ